jgi:hypothetical protein
VRQPRFAKFPAVGLGAIEHGTTDHLLRDGAGALHNAAAAQVGHHRGRNAAQIDAVVFVKAAILRGQHGLNHRLRHLLEHHRHPVFFVERGNDAILRVVDDRRLGAVVEGEPGRQLIHFLLDLPDAVEGEAHPD